MKSLLARASLTSKWNEAKTMTKVIPQAKHICDVRNGSVTGLEIAVLFRKSLKIPPTKGNISSPLFSKSLVLIEVGMPRTYLYFLVCTIQWLHQFVVNNSNIMQVGMIPENVRFPVDSPSNYDTLESLLSNRSEFEDVETETN